MIRLIILLATASLFLCCSSQHEKAYTLKFNGDSLAIGLNQDAGGYFYSKIYTYKDEVFTFFYYFSNADASLRMISREGDEKFIDLSPLLRSQINYLSGDDVHVWLDSPNTVWLDSPDDDSLYYVSLDNLKPLKVVPKSIGHNLHLLDLVETNLNFKTNELLLGIYGESEAAYGLFNIKNDTLEFQKEIGFRPTEYQEKFMYVESGIITRLNPDSFIVSYYYSDSVDLYVNNDFEKRIELKSDSSANFTGFKNGNGDINAIKKYFLMNQRYNFLLYDDSKNVFYRVFSFEKESTGKIEVSKKWSICVFDSNFNKIHEEYFHEDNYSKICVLLNNSELLLLNTKKTIFKSDQDSSTFVFDAFTLSQSKK